MRPVVTKCIIKDCTSDADPFFAFGGSRFDFCLPCFRDVANTMSYMLEKMESAPPIPCLNCGNPCKFYMVKDELWKEIGNPKGWMCFWCFRHRLRRRITVHDLTPASCNDWLREAACLLT